MSVSNPLPLHSALPTPPPRGPPVVQFENVTSCKGHFEGVKPYMIGRNSNGVLHAHI